MKSKMVTTLFLSAIVAIAVAFGQMGQPSTSGSKRSPHYDKATETTVKGVVENMSPTTTERNKWAQIHLTLKSGADTYDVHLGPSAYLLSQQFSFAKGDTIEVVGSKVIIKGQSTLLARKVTKDGKVLKLRDEEGFPVFAHRERQSSHSTDE